MKAIIVIIIWVLWAAIIVAWVNRGRR